MPHSTCTSCFMCHHAHPCFGVLLPASHHAWWCLWAILAQHWWLLCSSCGVGMVLDGFGRSWGCGWVGMGVRVGTGLEPVWPFVGPAAADFHLLGGCCSVTGQGLLGSLLGTTTRCPNVWGYNSALLWVPWSSVLLSSVWDPVWPKCAEPRCRCCFLALLSVQTRCHGQGSDSCIPLCALLAAQRLFQQHRVGMALLMAVRLQFLLTSVVPLFLAATSACGMLPTNMEPAAVQCYAAMRAGTASSPGPKPCTSFHPRNKHLYVNLHLCALK